MLSNLLNKSGAMNTTPQIRRDDVFSIDPPQTRPTGSSPDRGEALAAPDELSHDVQRRLREINASPLMNLPQTDEGGTGQNLCTGPGALLWGMTPGSLINAVSANQFPP